MTMESGRLHPLLEDLPQLPDCLPLDSTSSGSSFPKFNVPHALPTREMWPILRVQRKVLQFAFRIHLSRSDTDWFMQHAIECKVSQNLGEEESLRRAKMQLMERILGRINSPNTPAQVWHNGTSHSHFVSFSSSRQTYLAGRTTSTIPRGKESHLVTIQSQGLLPQIEKGIPAPQSQGLQSPQPLPTIIEESAEALVFQGNDAPLPGYSQFKTASNSFASRENTKRREHLRHEACPLPVIKSLQVIMPRITGKSKMERLEL